MHLLDAHKIKPKFARFLEALLIKRYKASIQNITNTATVVNSERDTIMQQIDMLTDRISKTSNEYLILSYEKKINSLCAEIRMLENNENPEVLDIDIGTAIKQTLNILEKPSKYWKEANLQKKKVLHHIAFSSTLPYSKNEGFGTVQKSILFSLFEQQDKGVSYLVDYLQKNWNQIFKEIQNIQSFFECQKSLS